MKDERIQSTLNRYAAVGFLVWYMLLSISLMCRALILKQPPREWWDILAIFAIGTLFVFIASARKGAFTVGFTKLWLPITIAVFAGNLAVFFLMGMIHSVADLGEYLIGFLPGMALVVGTAYLLTRNWERKEGLKDDE